jgi:KaiC/GvpD/RAD55 family RecA-like ATPase
MQSPQEIKFKKAIRHHARARLAIDGPSGAGKTFTSLIAAQALSDGQPVAVIDTEHGSASLYSDLFPFDVLELSNYDPRIYTRAIKAAEEAGYSVIVIDSLSHAWEGEGGALDQLDKVAKRSYSGSSFSAWKDITPLQRALVDAMLSSSAHIIATMRTRMEYVLEKDEKTGRTLIRKVGLAPVQRQGIEYEFQVVADMDIEHNLVIAKTRCKLLDGSVVSYPTAGFFKPYADWLRSSLVDSVVSPAEASGKELPPSSEKLSDDSVPYPVSDDLPNVGFQKNNDELARNHSLRPKRSWSADQVQALMVAGLAENSYNAVSLLNLSSLPSSASPSLCSKWASRYRDFRNMNDCEPLRAASVADAFLKLDALPDE